MHSDDLKKSRAELEAWKKKWGKDLAGWDIPDTVGMALMQFEDAMKWAEENEADEQVSKSEYEQHNTMSKAIQGCK